MKIKFDVGVGKAVISYKNDNATIEDAIDLLKKEEVIRLTVTKQTLNKYLKSKRCLNE